MKAEFLRTSERPGGAGYTTRVFVYQTPQTFPPCQFEIRAPFKEGLRAAEGVKVITPLDTPIKSLALKITLGTTTVAKIFTEQDKINDEYVFLELNLGLCDRMRDGKPNFEVDIDIYFAT